MTTFLIALSAVAVLLATAVPGFFLIKRKMVGEDCIPGLSKILLYVCQPCLSVYTFKSTAYSPELLGRVGIFALLCLAIHVLMLSVSYFVFRHKYDRPIYRVMTIGTCFGNCAFFGIPIIEALLPGVSSDLILYTTVYAFVMNMIGWTVGSSIIARDRKYINPKQIFLNPTVIGMAIALILFIGEIPIPGTLFDMITLVGRMSSPLSMIVMGMRLATVPARDIFLQPRAYLTVAIKQTVFPLVGFLLVFFLPLDPYVRQTFYIICACPIASVVLNYSEILGKGQGEASVVLMLSTILSIATLPLMMLLLSLLA